MSQLMEFSRIIGEIPRPGAKKLFIVMAGIHGDEVAGVNAARRIMELLDYEGSLPDCDFLVLAGNLQALQRRERFVDLDLNRMWSPGRTSVLEANEELGGDFAENYEQEEIFKILSPRLKGTYSQCFFLDLHSSSSISPPFSVVMAENSNWQMKNSPLPRVEGIRGKFKGTLIEYMEKKGAFSMAVEGGQHHNPATIDALEAMLSFSIASFCGEAEAGSSKVIRALKSKIHLPNSDIPKCLYAFYHHRILPEDNFVMNPGYSNFDPVKMGDVVAYNRFGPIISPEDARILFPLYNEKGEDGFLLVREQSA